jgi:DNA polymerase III subunit alpha
MSDPVAPARPFAHLHCHTTYSLLDGANKVGELVKHVKSLGMSAIAVTDHGNLYGALEFYSKCRDNGVNPILGYEAYIAPGSRRNKEGASRMKEAGYHLTLLAKNRTGFHNLIKLASTAFIDGFYYKPRIDKEVLREHREGIICLSGCAAGELSQLLLGERFEEAEKLAAWYVETFGSDYYLEIQNAGFQIQRDCGERTIDLAKKMGLPLVATNDAHYLRQEDAVAQDVLLCINTHTVRSDANRMKMDSDQLFVRSPEQMYEAFPGQEEAVARSQEIANGIEIELDLKTRHFPVFVPPDNKSVTDYFREQALAGVKWRYGDNPEPAVLERLDFELGVINKMGFASYFLIVWDFARFAMANDIPCSARGSACGALVSYVLGLSHVCPLKYDLLFERFLDPSRTEAPDIDIDFCRDRRELVIQYVKDKYGVESVAQIGTFGTLRAKAVIRDVARALGMPLNRADEIAKSVPDTLHITLRDALDESAELKSAYDSDPLVRETIDVGMKLEGLAKSAGTHAAGVVIGDRPLVEYVPLQKITGKDDILTQWTEVEKAGLLKMDFLGLRNLTILDLAVKNVKRHRGIQLDPLQFPLDDKPTFALLQRGETKGIFQLESGGMRDLLTKMKPDQFADIIATSALYRPGPLEGGMVMTYVQCKNGLQPVAKLHPAVDEVLAETYGVMVYQEQVMRILNRLGGIELPKAYACIKAISKKKIETIEKNRAEFIKGAGERGMAAADAENLFGLIEKFAGYGFNKSHSTAYAAIAYQTAYLKARYPVEFMAALLSCGMEDSDRIAEHVDDCRRMKVPVLPPDVNRSDVVFDVIGDKLIFGLAAIRGVSEQAIKALVAERNAKGPFKDIFDLCERVDPKILPKGTLEILIKAGALDSFGPNRAQHAAMVDRAIQQGAGRARDKQAGQKRLFGGDEQAPGPAASREAAAPISLPDVPDLTHAQKLAAEKEVIGFYLSSHPLLEFAGKLGLYSSQVTTDLAAAAERADVRLAGMISSIKKAQTKKPSRNGHTKYVNFDFEDVQGTVRCIMWPEEFARFGDLVKSESIVIVEGKVDKRSREPNLIVGEMLTLEQAEKKFTDQVAIRFDQALHGERELLATLSILKRHPGKCDTAIIVETFDPGNPNQRLRHLLSNPALKVSVGGSLAEELQALLGTTSVQFLTKNKPRRNGGSGFSQN